MNLEPCLCGKPTGVLSRYVGTELHHQVICSDSECPILKTFGTVEEAAATWNLLAAGYNSQKYRFKAEIILDNHGKEYARFTFPDDRYLDFIVGTLMTDTQTKRMLEVFKVEVS